MGRHLTARVVGGHHDGRMVDFSPGQRTISLPVMPELTTADIRIRDMQPHDEPMVMATYQYVPVRIGDEWSHYLLPAEMDRDEVGRVLRERGLLPPP